MSDFESIEKGLKEALAFSEGKSLEAVVHKIDVPDIDVQAIRNRTGMSQVSFARSIGVAKGTLLNWEQGRRQPTGAARVLLALIDKQPDVVQSLLQSDGP